MPETKTERIAELTKRRKPPSLEERLDRMNADLDSRLCAMEDFRDEVNEKLFEITEKLDEITHLISDLEKDVYQEP